MTRITSGRVAVSLLVAVVLASACSSAAEREDNPVAALRLAGRKTLSGGVVDFSVVLGERSPRESISGVIDFSNRRTACETLPSDGAASFAGYQSRYVGGWNYIGIASSVYRPPRLRTGALWVAFRAGTQPGRLPIPDVGFVPDFPLTLVNEAATGSFAAARFVGSGEVKVIAATFSDQYGPNQKRDFTLDSLGRITAIGTPGRGKLIFTYDEPPPNIAAPPAAVVQFLAPGEDLYAPA